MEEIFEKVTKDFFIHTNIGIGEQKAYNFLNSNEMQADAKKYYDYLSGIDNILIDNQPMTPGGVDQTNLPNTPRTPEQQTDLPNTPEQQTDLPNTPMTPEQQKSKKKQKTQKTDSPSSKAPTAITSYTAFYQTLQDLNDYIKIMDFGK